MLGIYLDRTSSLTITAQLCMQMRHKIEQGEWTAGMRLPSTRNLALELGIARNVAIDAYEQLIAEGYLCSRTGSGTYVAEGIDSELMIRQPLSHFDFPETQDQDDLIDFEVGTPDLRSFPKHLWAKYLKSSAEDASSSHYHYGDVFGEPELRVEISRYLYRTRGMSCSPEQIMVVSGSTEGISLIANVFRSSYSTICLEDPTIDFTQKIFHNHGYQIQPIAVDGSGMKVQDIQTFDQDHLLLLTPSHQFPSGSILSIHRRQNAIRLVERFDSYIIEDDYDGDFRLKGVPIPPIYALNPDRVLYIGTFSKSLAPGLRMAFVVLPSPLVERFRTVREEWNIRTSSIPQIALARFIRDGRFDRHIHRMKRVYRSRRHVLIQALKRYWGNQVEIRGDQAGMHVQVDFLRLLQPVDWHSSVKYGVRVHPVDDYRLLNNPSEQQIVLGYGNTSETDIERGIDRLHQFLQAVTASST